MRWTSWSSRWSVAGPRCGPCCSTRGRGGAAQKAPSEPASRPRWTAWTTRTVHRLQLARATKADDGLVATVLSRPLARRLTPLALRAGPDAEHGDADLRGPRARRGRLPRDGRRARAGGRRGPAPAVPGRGLRGRRRRALHPPVQRGGCLAGRRHRPDQGVRLLRRARVGIGRGMGRVARRGRDAHAADGPAHRGLHVHRRQGGPRGRVRPAAAGAGRRRRPGSGIVGERPCRPAAVSASERSNRRPAVRWTKKALHLGHRRAVARPVRPGGRRPAAWWRSSCSSSSAWRRWRTRAPVGSCARGPGRRPGPRRGSARSSWRRPTSGRSCLRRPPQVLARSGPGGGRFLWVRPALLRVAEYAAVVGVVAATSRDLLGPAFAVLLVVASHHYDDLYRVLQGLPPTGRSAWLGLGAPGRVLLVAVLAALGPRSSRGGPVGARRGSRHPVRRDRTGAPAARGAGARSGRPGPGGRRWLTVRRSPS